MRRERGLSQRALGEAAGVTRQAISAIESGRMQPSVGIALKLARALGTTVERLFEPGENAVARRVAGATIGDRVVTHPLEGDYLALEPGESASPNVFVAGCDIAVGLLARHTAMRSHGARALWLKMTNREALDAVARGTVHAAVVHGDAERTRSRRIADVVRFELATTQEGWLLERGNPLNLRGAADVAGPRVRLVNRPVGSGARALLDAQLRRAHIDPQHVLGYGRELAGQLDAGRAVAQGFADVAVGWAASRGCSVWISYRYAKNAVRF